MNKKLANLTVEKSADYYDSIVKTLEKAGFLIVLEYETTNEKCYMVAKAESENP